MVASMQIYFACSITGGRAYEPVYQQIVETILASGAYVPTAHLAQPGVMALEAVIDPKDVYTRDIAWIESSAALVAEVSTPSHGVGYEIAYALAIGKPVLCCYQEGKSISKMITGNTMPGLEVAPYRTDREAVQAVSRFLQKISE